MPNLKLMYLRPINMGSAIREQEAGYLSTIPFQAVCVAGFLHLIVEKMPYE
jgi:hypothetical protein